MVYFIQQSPSELIKIGYTRNLAHRLSGLQTGFPEKLTVLGTVKGGRKLEKDLHVKFSHLRKSGEWFSPGEDLIQFIKEAVLLETDSPDTELHEVLTQTSLEKLKEVGYLIAVARQQRKMSCIELANRVGVNRRTLGQLEKGSPAVTIGTLFQTLDVLGLLRGLEEVVRPENDLEAVAQNVNRIRRKMVKGRISAERVNF